MLKIALFYYLFNELAELGHAEYFLSHLHSFCLQIDSILLHEDNFKTKSVIHRFASRPYKTGVIFTQRREAKTKSENILANTSFPFWPEGAHITPCKNILGLLFLNSQLQVADEISYPIQFSSKLLPFL